MKKYLLLPLISVAIALLLPRCATSNIDFVTSRYDQAKKEKRIRLRITFPYVRDRYTTFHSAKKDILKIIPFSGETRYQVFDLLKVSINSYPLSDTVFLIADNRTYPIKVYHRKTELLHHTQTQKQQIMKADSTTVSVITGMKETEYKSIQLQYTLNRQEIKALQNATSVSFQYYANPDIYKLNLSHHVLNKLKKFFALQ